MRYSITDRLWCGGALALLVLCMSLRTAPGAAIVVYDFDGSNLNASAKHDAVAPSAFAHNGNGTPGFNLGNPTSGEAYRAGSWPIDGTLDDYFSFSMTISQGWIVQLDDLAFDNRRSATGPTNWVVQYSMDDSTFYALGAGKNTFTDTWVAEATDDARPLDLTGTVYFRMYATNAPSGAGRWRVDNVTVNGTISIDDGTRIIRSHSFDTIHSDTWTHTTNAGLASIDRSSGKTRSGAQSLRLSGSNTQDADPYVTFDNAELIVLTNVLGDVEPVTFTVGFAADNPDSGDDLELDLSYDNGATWIGAGSTQLVLGFGNVDVEFDTTSASNPTTVDDNPYAVTLALVQTQMAVRVRFDEPANNNLSDPYYIDDIQLSGVPVPATNSPAMGNTGGPTSVSTNQATLGGHVRGGYPYPLVRIYWGPNDGGTSVSAWAYHETIGSNRWGLVSVTATNLVSGQQYFYRAYGLNEHGAGWAETTTNFTTAAIALNENRVMYLDSLGVAKVMPMAIDRDLNGLPDRWETQYLGSTGNDPNADPDGDGVSTRREFLAGTHPNDIGSFLAFVSADLVSETSEDVVLSWTGGTWVGTSPYTNVGDAVQRSYRVGTGSVGGGAKTPNDSVIGGFSDNHSWTDSNVAQQVTAQYYDVSVTFAGNSYSTTEEWAMHRQARSNAKKIFMSVPVNHGNPAANNLNSTLGHQLGRGLHPDNLLISPDTIEILLPDNTWKVYSLVTNDSGQMYWWDADLPGAANVTIAPGTGIFVNRGSGTRQRNNTVFVGRSWTDATVEDISFGTNFNGWTAFGWPFPTPRGQIADGTSTPVNSLGFADIGSGGSGNLFDPESRRGDRIWVWDDNGNEWQTFYELMGNIGANWDGRWWHRQAPGGPDYADISLSIGKGYFYRHVVNQWGGTNFTWKPVSP